MQMDLEVEGKIEIKWFALFVNNQRKLEVTTTWQNNPFQSDEKFATNLEICDMNVEITREDDEQKNSFELFIE